MNSIPRDLEQAVELALSECFGPSTRLTAFRGLPQSASTRSYYRLHLTGEGPESVVLMRLPENPFGSDEVTTEEAFRELPFCTMQKILGRLRVPVPAIYADCTLEGFLLLEDLGDNTMLASLEPSDERCVEQFYSRAIDLLVCFQGAMLQSLADPGTDTTLVQRRSFDYELLRWELEHFKEWLLVHWAGATLSEAQERVIDTAFDDIASRVTAMSYVPVHRDFQSTNLMVHNDSLTLIDFQDALMGPPVYDVVSLLRDSYVPLQPLLLERLKDRYYREAEAVVPIGDRGEFETLFRLQTLQRKLKDAGRFVFIDRVRSNPGFLRFIEPTLGFVADALDASPEYRELQSVLAGLVKGLVR